METRVFAAVLFSAFFQAGWNFLTKRSTSDKISLLAGGWFALGVVMLPFALWTTPWGEFQPQWIMAMLASGVIHAAYLALLGRAYNMGDISVVYPIARGLGVAGSTILAMLFLSVSLSSAGLAALAAISGGVILIGLKEWPQQDRRPSFFAALGVGLAVSCYSVVDSWGAQQVPLILYLTSMNLVSSILVFPFLMRSRRQLLIDVLRNHKRQAFLVAVAGSFAYWIILWAYQRSPAPYVAGLREVSVVIAAFLGWTILKEKISRRQLAGIGLILVGLVLIKLV